MTTKTEQIRTLNDQLRQNFSEGTAVLTCGVAALGAEAVARSSRRLPCLTTSARPTILIKSTILARSKPTATSSFLRSIISTRPRTAIRQMRLIDQSPSA